MSDLSEFIAFPSVEALNEKQEHSWQNALKKGYREDAGLFLESDTDEQLLINIPFTQAVKLTSITIRAVDADTAPRKVRVFVNRPSIGFPEAEADPATAEFELDVSAATASSKASTASTEGSSGSNGGGGGAKEVLKVAKFTNVNSIAIFFADNHGDAETTRVGAILLEGSAGETFNVAEIKKVGEEGGAGGAVA